MIMIIVTSDYRAQGHDLGYWRVDTSIRLPNRTQTKTKECTHLDETEKIKRGNINEQIKEKQKERRKKEGTQTRR